MCGQTDGVEHTAEIFVNADPVTVADVVADLSTYPLWNDVVASAEHNDNDNVTVAWLTTLRARVGPFARSKQLRMVRSEHRVVDQTHTIRFIRSEIDGREHSAWIMKAGITPVGDQRSRVVLGLEYDGGLWNPALDLVLGAAIDRATRNLSAFLEARSV
jgi:hypothetical protein